MPKIHERSFYYQKKDGDGRFKLTIKVSQEGQFYVDPKEFSEEIRLKIPHCFPDYKKRFDNETYQGLINDVEKIIKSYEELNMEETREKFIVYKINLQGDLTPDLSYDHPKSRRFDDLDKFRSGLGVGVTIAWHIVWKYTLGDRERYTWHQGGSDVGHMLSGYKEMPWTRERENWFEDLESSMLHFMDRVDKFLRQPKPEALMLKIDQGATLLSAPPTDGEELL